MEAVALFGIGQDCRAGIIEEHQMHLLRPVALPWPGRPGIERVVTGHRLAGARGGEDRQEHGQIVEMLHYLLNARQRNMHARQGGGEPGISLVLRDRDLARFGDEEIGPGDPHVGIDIELPHVAPGDHRQLLGAVGGGGAQILGKEIADLPAANMHAGEDKVIGRLATQLLDEFTQIALHNPIALLLERRVEVDLLARHALALDDRLRLGGPHQPQNNLACLLGIAGPVQLPAVGGEIVGKARQQFIQPIHRRPLGQAGGIPGGLPVAIAGLLRIAGDVVASQRLAHKRPVIDVAHTLGGIVEKALLGPPRGLLSRCRVGRSRAVGRGVGSHGNTWGRRKGAQPT
jgi:hypothetical protein